MEKTEIFDLLDDYSRATHLPISCFIENELVKKTTGFVADFNLPMLLLDCLPKELPPVWYSISPEYMYMAGLTVPEINMKVFIGPAHVFDCSREQAACILERIGRSRRDVSELIRFFRSLGSCDAVSIQAGIKILQRLILNSCTLPQQLEFHWNSMLRFSAYCIPEPEHVGAIPLENELVECIEKGNSDKLEHIIMNEMLIGKGENIDDPRLFRNRSNIMCSANFFCSRIALRANLDISLVTMLFEQYDRRIQQASNISELTYIFVEFIREYTRQIAVIKGLQTNSPMAERVNYYVVSHLYENITPTLLSEYLNINLSYLCRQFKKATGKTITCFVQERKVEEAMHLLKQKTFTVTSVSQLLGFSSTSYFCAIFKKYAGMTPAGYQRKK